MKPESKVLVSLIVLTLLVSAGMVSPAQVILAKDDSDLRSAVRTRTLLGLPADPTHVATLRGSADDAGSARWNIPLTRVEAAEVQARFAFASETRKAVLPFAEKLPTFAGAYYDHQARGELVILLTAADDTVQSKIQALAPAGRRTRVHIVAHTEAELRAALPTAWEAWRAVGGPEAYAIAVDTQANAIRIDVDAANLDAAEQHIAQVSAAIGLPVSVGVGERANGVACTDREHCTDPMYAGNVIHRDSTTGYGCTMGFHIKAGTDVQFVTSGHCGSVGSNFYHQGYNFVGSVLKTQYGNNGRDIMTVQMPDAQGSSVLYAKRSITITGALDPYNGEGVCASRGWSSTAWGCGVVETAYTSYLLTNCNCTLFGSDSSIATIGGDSGSPVVDANDGRVAIGVMSSDAGHFARIEDALAAWGYTVR